MTDGYPSDSQPDTAPAITSECPNDEVAEEYKWGALVIPFGDNETVIEFDKDHYLVGRSPSCDISLAADQFCAYFTQISKTHFQIVRRNLDNGLQVVYLEDLSTNGTFINGKKVGKKRRATLNSRDVICLSSPSNKAFVYINYGTTDNWIAEPLRKKFYVLNDLGAGGFGQVKLVLEKSSRQLFAMKKILKGGQFEEKIYSEVKILKALSHPFIVKLDGIFEMKDAMYLALEYVSGGDLLKILRHRHGFSEDTTKFIFRQLSLAIEYLHRQGITHRDLKPENILVTDVSGLDNGKSCIKLTDFGLSKLISSQTDLRTTCGTLMYVAPEIISPRFPCYTNSVDIWSMGIVLFLCLSGEYPFKCDDRLLHSMIIRGAVSFSSKWSTISDSSKELVKGMLVVQPNLRFAIDEVLDHPWLKDKKVIQKVDSLMNKISPIFMNENEDPVHLIQKAKKMKLETSDENLPVEINHNKVQVNLTLA